MNIENDEIKKTQTNNDKIVATVAKKKKRSQKPMQQKIKRRRKKQREEGAPKAPLTGYVRYMNFRRDAIKKEFPDKTSGEHIKKIAEEWNELSEEIRKPYLEAAEKDKQRYYKQMKEFNKQKIAASDTAVQSVIPYTPIEKNEVGNQSSNNCNASSSVYDTITTSSISNGKDGIFTARSTRQINDNIPIFTDEFLEHNKTVDLELRTLRKSNIDFEQQNSVLEKHIENMKFGVEKIDTENLQLQEKKKLLESYLQKLKVKLANAFSSLSLPTQPNGANVENIELYMSDLYNMASSSNYGPASLNKAKDIIRKLDLQISL